MINSVSKCQDKCSPRAANWLALGRRALGRCRTERPGEGRHLARARYLSGEHTATAAAAVNCRLARASALAGTKGGQLGHLTHLMPPIALAFTSAPWSSSKRATSKQPRDEASCNDVKPALSRAFTSQASDSRQKRTTSWNKQRGLTVRRSN